MISAEEFKDVTAEATGSLVVQAAEALGVKLTSEMATPLFAAVATDTGWYRFPSATAGCYRTAAKLIDAALSRRTFSPRCTNRTRSVVSNCGV